MLAAVILAHDLRTVMFPSRSSRDLDSLRVWFQLTETLHQGASDDRSPAIWGLHDFGGGVNGRTDGFAKVGVLANTTDQQHGLDLLLSGSDLAPDQCDDFVHNGIEDGFDLGAVHLELATSDALGWIIGQSRD